MKFYFSKGSGSLAAHILLEEAGAEYESVEIPRADQENRSQEYLKVNPKGLLPALETPDGILTENPAILAHVARLFPKMRLAPSDPWQMAKAQELNAYIASTIHVAIAHFRRGTRWSDDPVAIRSMRAYAPKNLRDGALILENRKVEGPWSMGRNYSMCDPFVFQACRWIEAAEIDLAEFPRLSALKEAVIRRPATKAAMELHGLP